MSEKQEGLLRDILNSAEAIQSYLGGVSHESFTANLEKQDAVLRRFEIIGEAASRLSPETQSMFPGLPFRSMRGMRNIIAHDYGEVDIDLVWNTATNDLPVLIAELRTHFS
jgi:uncharacterized protein with HEPN domain